MREPLVWIILGSVALTVLLNTLGIGPETRQELLVTHGRWAIPLALAVLGACFWYWRIRANRK